MISRKTNVYYLSPLDPWKIGHIRKNVRQMTVTVRCTVIYTYIIIAYLYVNIYFSIFSVIEIYKSVYTGLYIILNELILQSRWAAIWNQLYIFFVSTWWPWPTMWPLDEINTWPLLDRWYRFSNTFNNSLDGLYPNLKSLIDLDAKVSFQND